MQDSDLLIPVSVGLLNKLRNFEHESHSFKAKYLEEVNDLLTTIFQGKNRLEKYQVHSNEFLTLTIHYYLALITNVDTLVNLLDANSKVEQLNTTNFNGTNIFNIHSILRALEALRNSKQQEESTSPEIQLISKFTLRIALGGKLKATKEELVIPYEMVFLVFIQ
jgi:hypothetical protein